MQPALPDTRKFFYEHLGINERLLEQCLSAALSAGGDYADLYFEYITASSLMVDESASAPGTHIRTIFRRNGFYARHIRQH
jgi:hypothetical protein